MINIFTEIKRFPRNLIRGLKWFKRGYHCYDWDDHFLMDVILFKLQDMQKFWSNPDNIHIIESSRLKTLKQITICVECLKRLEADDYSDMCGYEEYWGKWGDLTWKGSVLKNHKNIKTEQDKIQSSKELKQIHTKADKLKKQDQDLFFKTFQKYYEYWWD